LCGGEGVPLENLRDWMAMAPDQQFRLAMIVLVGTKGVGKTQFARGMAKLWVPSGNPVEMSFIFDTFQEDLLSCPFLFADEEFPKDSRGRISSARLRAYISQKEHRFNRKGLSKVQTTGYLRFATAVNSMKHVDALSEHNQNPDIEALLIRMFLLECNPLAGNFWKQSFVDNNELAEHSLWLQKQRQALIVADPEATYGIRNLQTPEKGKTHLLAPDSLKTLEALARFLRDRSGEELGTPPAFVAGRGLYVEARAFQESWEKYFDIKTKRPTYEKVREVLKDLAEKEEIVRNNAGTKHRYFRIKGATLLDYLSERATLDPQLELVIYSGVHKYLNLPKHLRPKAVDVLRKEQALKLKEKLAEEEEDEDS